MQFAIDIDDFRMGLVGVPISVAAKQPRDGVEATVLAWDFGAGVCAREYPIDVAVYGCTGSLPIGAQAVLSTSVRDRSVGAWICGGATLSAPGGIVNVEPGATFINTGGLAIVYVPNGATYEHHHHLRGVIIKGPDAIIGGEPLDEHDLVLECPDDVTLDTASAPGVRLRLSRIIIKAAARAPARYQICASNGGVSE